MRENIVPLSPSFMYLSVRNNGYYACNSANIGVMGKMRERKKKMKKYGQINHGQSIFLIRADLFMPTILFPTFLAIFHFYY